MHSSHQAQKSGASNHQVRYFCPKGSFPFCQTFAILLPVVFFPSAWTSRSSAMIVVKAQGQAHDNEFDVSRLTASKLGGLAWTHWIWHWQDLLSVPCSLQVCFQSQVGSKCLIKPVVILVLMPHRHSQATLSALQPEYVWASYIHVHCWLLV